MNHKLVKKHSKFLSLLLRHKPEVIGLELDKQGWTSVPVLIDKMNTAGRPIDLPMLELIVQENNKKRFSFNADKSMIRANQGHSIAIELGLEERVPPKQLYHGTAKRFLHLIFEGGLKKMSRHHVHLSADKSTASNVGARHGKLELLLVDTERMYADGHKFYCSDNGVWLTDHVPVAYLQLV